MIAVIIVSCILGYIAIFAGFGLIERWACGGSHTYCNHPFESPIPLFWPLFLFLATISAPFILVYFMFNPDKDVREFFEDVFGDW